MGNEYSRGPRVECLQYMVGLCGRDPDEDIHPGGVRCEHTRVQLKSAERGVFGVEDDKVEFSVGEHFDNNWSGCLDPGSNQPVTTSKLRSKHGVAHHQFFPLRSSTRAASRSMRSTPICRVRSIRSIGIQFSISKSFGPRFHQSKSRIVISLPVAGMPA